ncbi:MAG: hypothetical protein ACK4WF_00765 [Candidatus Brocadiales bacterium]
MLVALSDLHLQDIESQSDPKTRSAQNVHHEAFVDFLQWVSEEYLDKYDPEAKTQKEIKIVLNGDIIDFLRTERWFGTNERPYEDYHAQKNISWEDPTQFPTLNQQVDNVLLEIFNAVTGIQYGVNYSNATPNVETIKALAILRRFKREVEGLGGAKPCEGHKDINSIFEDKNRLQTWVEALNKLGVRIQYVFIPGNHDRLVNVSSRLNAAFRDFFLIENSQGKENYSAERFPWELRIPEYGVFLRHGHVYDWTNGEENLVFQRKDAKNDKYSFKWQKGTHKGYMDSKLYYNTPIGDLITIDFLTFMPYHFIREYYKPGNKTLEKICKRLREIDDVRPQPAVLPWLYEIVEGDNTLWKQIAGVVEKAIDTTFSKDPGTAQGEFFGRWNSTHDRRFFLDKSDLFEDAIPRAKKLLKKPRNLFKEIYFLMEKFNMGGEDNPVPELIKKYIKKNKHPFMDSPQDYYVAGHIHSSTTHFLQEKKVYHCTGTWRSVFSRCRHKDEFKRMKSMNFIYFFRRNERKGLGGRVYIWRGLLEEEKGQ